MNLDQKLRDCISELISRIDSDAVNQYRLTRISVYRNGFETRIEHTKYAIENLVNLIEELPIQNVVEDHSKTDGSSLTKTQIYFYSDAFWGFLLSSLDIFGQLVNQIMDLRLDEEHISFAGVLNHLKQTEPDHDMLEILEEIKQSNAFINTKKYRHCLTHRRSIAFTKEVHTKEVWGGYNQTEINVTEPITVSEVVLFTCDNPGSVLNPVFRQSRKIPDYLEKSRRILIEKLIKAITKIEIR